MIHAKLTMNKIVVFLTIMSVRAENVQISSLKNLTGLESNLFRENHKNLLKISNNFTNCDKIQLLLSMHNNLNNISENFYINFKEIENTVQVEADNKTEKALFNLTEIIDDIFERNSKYNVYNNIFVENELKQIDNNIANNILPNANETLKQLLPLFISYLNKVNRLTVEDTDTPLNNLVNSTANVRLTKRYRRRKKTYDLKVWRPSKNHNSGEENKFYNLTHSRRIFKGKKTKIKKYPFVVSIHMLGRFVCAGSIISEDLVITAASCLQLAYNNRFFRENPTSLSIRAGSEYTQMKGEVIPVLEVYFHPGYDPKRLSNNLAIVRLKSLLALTNRNRRRVRRIEYDRNKWRLPENFGGIMVLGWGDKDIKHKIVANNMEPLSLAKLDIYNLHNCKEIYSREYVTDKNFCAGYLSKGGGACNRDIGGPGIVEGTLIGVVSLGPPVCGTPDAPTVFTKVGHYVDWIDEISNMDRVTSNPKHKRTTFGLNTETTTQSYRFTKPTAPPPHQGLNIDLLDIDQTQSLRFLLMNMISKGDINMSDFLYENPDGEIEEKDFWTTTTMDPSRHPLLPPTHKTNTNSSITLVVPETTPPFGSPSLETENIKDILNPIFFGGQRPPPSRTINNGKEDIVNGLRTDANAEGLQQNANDGRNSDNYELVDQYQTYDENYSEEGISVAFPKTPITKRIRINTRDVAHMYGPTDDNDIQNTSTTVNVFSQNNKGNVLNFLTSPESKEYLIKNSLRAGSIPQQRMESMRMTKSYFKGRNPVKKVEYKQIDQNRGRVIFEPVEYQEREKQSQRVLAGQQMRYEEGYPERNPMKGLEVYRRPIVSYNTNTGRNTFKKTGGKDRTAIITNYEVEYDYNGSDKMGENVRKSRRRNFLDYINIP